MKKILLLLALLPLMANAYDVQIDGIYYNLITKAKQAEVTCLSTDFFGGSNSNAYSGSVTIPSTITYNDVTYNVTKIGDMAFANCSALTEVAIPNSVTSIGAAAFYYCSGLTSVAIPSGVTSIGSSAFYYCRGLTEVTIPNGVTEIGSSAFSYCYDLKSVTIPASVTSIGSEAFRGSSDLTSVHITDIEAWCKISFPDDSSNPLCYAHHLYMDGKEINDLVIPNSVTKIENWAFYNCYSLTSVTIPNSVTLIGERAFNGCSSLTKVSIPNSVTYIGYEAFNYCTSLKEVTIPNSVTYLGLFAFSNCSGLTDVTIGSGVTDIGSHVFAYCSSLKEVTIPDNVTSIGDMAFYSCSSLTSATIGNGVTSIGAIAFYECSSLKEVTIGSGVTSIGNNAFANCSELTDVYCYAEKVPNTESDIFQNSYIEYVNLYVPEASVASYKATAPWSSFGTIKTLSGEIPETPKCATPTISLVNGKLEFACDTEGVEFVSKITCPDPGEYEGSSIPLTTTYTVTVYAKKDDYEDSDVATAEINVGGGETGVRGDVNLDNEIGMPDVMFIVNYILNGKFPDEE